MTTQTAHTIQTSQARFFKPHAMGRTCKYCGSQRHGAQPLRLNGERGFWHIECFEKARKETRKG